MSKITITNNNLINGIINVPASKSYLHRAIIASSLASGRSVIKNITLSNDILATLHAMEKLGAHVEIGDDELIIDGITNFKLDNDIMIDCGESGSTLRFIIPILTLFTGNIKLTGSYYLFSRPMNVYEKLFEENNAKFLKKDNEIIISGTLTDFSNPIDGTISSQFITGLLFMLPLLNKDTTLYIDNLESKPYLDLSIDLLKTYGITVDCNKDYSKIYVKGNQKYNPAFFNNVGDYSQAANFYVLRALTKANIEIFGLNPNSLQGDKVILDVVDKYNKMTLDKNKLFKKNKLVIDIKDTPDVGPIIMVLLSRYGGVIKNYERLVYKESNRIEAMTSELAKFGVSVTEEKNKIIVSPYNGKVVEEVIDSHNDHRICMAMAIMGLWCNQEITISNYECIDKSYPNFFYDLEAIGVKIEKHE